MSVEETQSQSPKFRGSGSDSNPLEGSEKPLDVSEVIPFMINITSRNESDEDDDIMNYIPRMERNTEWQDKMSGGSWNMDTSPPSSEQYETEKKIRTILFSDMNVQTTNETIRGNIPDYDSDSDMFMSGGSCSMYPETYTKEQIEAEKEVHAALFKDIQSDGWYKANDIIYNAMLNSPMFQNNDGFTAMNDFGLSIKPTIDTSTRQSDHQYSYDPKDGPIGTEPAESFGIAAANDEAETTVDDFFPAPFIPFTM